MFYTFIYVLILFVLSLVQANECLLDDSDFDSECASYCYRSVKPFLSYIPSVQKRLEDCETVGPSYDHNRFSNMEKILEQQVALTKSLHEKIDALRNRQNGEDSKERLAKNNFNLTNALIRNLETLRIPQTSANVKKFFKKIGLKHYYIEDTEKLTWIGALQRCSKLGGHLANFQNEEEWKNVKKELKMENHYWLDINDIEKEGTFVSATTGEVPKFANWKNGEPNGMHTREDCAELIKSDVLNDAACSDQLNFICELDTIETKVLKSNRRMYQKIGDKYYHIENVEKLSWINALQTCSRWGGHLASLQTELEWRILRTQLQTGKNYWLDLNFVESEGKTKSATTDKMGQFVAWSIGEPNNQDAITNDSEYCVELRSDSSFEMYDYKCITDNYFICEMNRK